NPTGRGSTMMVELRRYVRQEMQYRDEGEDDGMVSQDNQPQGALILINPAYVAAMFESTETPGMTVIRGPDGRGLSIAGTYAEVKAALFPSGELQDPYPHRDEPAGSAH